MNQKGKIHYALQKLSERVWGHYSQEDIDSAVRVFNDIKRKSRDPAKAEGALLKVIDVTLGNIGQPARISVERAESVTAVVLEAKEIAHYETPRGDYTSHDIASAFKQALFTGRQDQFAPDRKILGYATRTHSDQGLGHRRNGGVKNSESKYHGSRDD